MFVFWWMIKFKYSVEVFYPLLQTEERNRRADIYLILSEASLCFFHTVVCFVAPFGISLNFASHTPTFF